MCKPNHARSKDTERSSEIRLALSPKEAARALGIGERLLWSKTKAGEIPHMRLGSRIVYPVDVLREWMREQAKAKRRPE